MIEWQTNSPCTNPSGGSITISGLFSHQVAHGRHGHHGEIYRLIPCPSLHICEENHLGRQKNVQNMLESENMEIVVGLLVLSWSLIWQSNRNDVTSLETLVC